MPEINAPRGNHYHTVMMLTKHLLVMFNVFFTNSLICRVTVTSHALTENINN